MSIKSFFTKRHFKYISNTYLYIGLFFIIWMLFLDTNSWLFHRKLDKELDNIKNNKKYYEEEFTKDEKLIKVLEDTAGVQNYAREKFFMKKENEDVYIIEYENE